MDEHAANHLADTHDDLPRVNPDAANEDAGEKADDDSPQEESANAG